MPISPTELRFFKSSSGTSLGGPISVTEIVSNVINNLFDNVNSSEALSGDTEYRCFYVQNSNSTIPLLNAVIYVLSNTTSEDTEIDIGLDPVGVNSTAPAIANESTAPVGVIFSKAENFSNALDIGTLSENGGYQAVWIRRTVSANAAAIAEDSATITIQGETTA